MDEGFNKKEWLEENGVKEGKTWVPVRGKVKTEFCDVKICGKVVGPCWPINNGLTLVDLSSDEEERLSLNGVQEVRYYVEDDGEREERDDGGDIEEPEER